MPAAPRTEPSTQVCFSCFELHLSGEALCPTCAGERSSGEIGALERHKAQRAARRARSIRCATPRHVATFRAAGREDLADEAARALTPGELARVPHLTASICVERRLGTTAA